MKIGINKPLKWHNFIPYLNQIIITSYHHGEDYILEGCGTQERVQAHLEEIPAVPFYLVSAHQHLLVVVLELVKGVRIQVDFVKASMPHHHGNLSRHVVQFFYDLSAHFAMKILMITPSYQKVGFGSSFAF